jgi:hypothetical protein
VDAVEVEVAVAAAVQQPYRAVEAEVALRCGAAAEAVTVRSFGAVVEEFRLFAEDLTSAAARTCACGPASTFAIGREAIGGAIVTAIADHASACTSEEAVGGVTGTIGAGACCAIVTDITLGCIAMGVGVSNFR